MKDQLRNVIKALRKERKWNQAFMASQLSMVIPAYSNLETGVTSINFEKLCNIAEVFELKPFELVEMIEPVEERTKYKIDALQKEIDKLVVENEHANYLLDLINKETNG